MKKYLLLPAYLLAKIPTGHPMDKFILHMSPGDYARHAPGAAYFISVMGWIAILWLLGLCFKVF